MVLIYILCVILNVNLSFEFSVFDLLYMFEISIHIIDSINLYQTLLF